ncbi:hypothetical protein EOA60_02090 [Mesorhizobium sp. M1A.F.Ca.IN.020.06.1.1]|uniref:hypothetical protein n=1 Tax=unclassified Mesorhizobium TaxID=325217 RepID=UPI000FCA21CA|nr:MULTISPECIES: hypothetical protein [unclassified Mesorhizobium]RUV82452.1 hypothetical protein EOA51_28495 [Mesorhizobium sp. M1A.F.Ca.IN.020.32.1.1]RUW06557.1 hypothetical protein EOA46_25820 [Mesorhizobium sp. M1A.F.Ca.IN.022.05.2.1]RUW36823.1 hypothetical protein EOA60_02090 [Mesorhizobium sp. M1A.F.Ca.IN.020.06.1.1]RWF82465.1 MAG: hypothetical protein EOQ35_10040 [Mesorhizobium sp.]RWF97819.1 MAG: hypothetical protein EOQ38_22060 [Mesorhizobium sp.]
MANPIVVFCSRSGKPDRRFGRDRENPIVDLLAIEELDPSRSRRSDRKTGAPPIVGSPSAAIQADFGAPSSAGRSILLRETVIGATVCGDRAGMAPGRKET